MASAAVQQPQGSHFSSSTPHFQTATPATLPNKKAPRDITATFNYYSPNADGSPPAPAYVGKPESYERPVEPHNLTLHDIRGSETDYSLDTTGFQVVNHTSAEKDFIDEAAIKSGYYAEIEELLKKSTGATKIFIFDHTIRRSSADGTASVARGPVQRVHIDQSYPAAKARVSYHLPEEAERLLAGRYQIINVWRPIKTVLKDPLAVASANSVKDEDLVGIKLIYPNREGETYSVKYADGHRWHYVNQQAPNEVLLIKCFDSEEDGRARRVPHTAVIDEEREGETGRESIEVRSLVFYEN